MGPSPGELQSSGGGQAAGLEEDRTEAALHVVQFPRRQRQAWNMAGSVRACATVLQSVLCVLLPRRVCRWITTF